MPKKIIPGVIVLVFLILQTNAYASEGGVSYTARADFYLMNSYSEGENIKADIKIENAVNYPLFDVSVTARISEGCAKPVYPTELSDCDNMFYERTAADNLTIFPGGSVAIPFIYEVPEGLGGDFRVDVFANSGRMYAVGIIDKFFEPESKTFEAGGSGKFPAVKILRSRTETAGGLSQSDTLAEPGQIIRGNVAIRNTEEEDFEGFLEIKIFYESDMREDYIKKISHEIYIPAESDRTIPFEFISEDRPGPYQIRFEVSDVSGRTHSIYKNSIFVDGKYMKIQKGAFGSWKLEADGKNNATMLISGPVFPSAEVAEDVSAGLTIEKGGKVLFTEIKDIGDIGAENPAEVFFDIDVSKDTDNFDACFFAYSGGKEADRYCIKTGTPPKHDIIDDIKAGNMTDEPVSYSMNSGYNPITEEIILDVCVESDGEPIRSSAVVRLTDSSGNIANETELLIDGCERLKYPASPGRSYTAAIERDGVEESAISIEVEKKFEFDRELYFIAAGIILLLFLVSVWRGMGKRSILES